MSQILCGELCPQDRKLGAGGRGSVMANTLRAGRVQRREDAREDKGVTSQIPNTSGNNCTHQLQKHDGYLHSAKRTHSLTALQPFHSELSDSL